VLVVAFVTIKPMVFGLPNPFDEGFIASGAMMILDGWLPIRDFYVLYGPGQYYSVAAVYQLFGQDLAVSRTLHVAQLALFAVALAAAAIVTSRGRIGVVMLVAAAMILGAASANPSALYPAIPAALLLVVSALALDRWFLTKSAKWMLAASTGVGLALLYRWDFGVLGLAALGGAVIVARFDARATVRETARDLLLLTLPVLVIAAVGFAPFVYLGGWQRWAEEVPLFLGREFAKWRGTRMMGATVDRLATAWGAGNISGMLVPAYQLSYVLTPFVLITATLARVALRLRRGPNSLDRTDAFALAVALVCLSLLNQMRVRPHMWQGLSAFAVSLPLLGYLLQRRVDEASTARRTARVTVFAGVVLVLVLLPLHLLQQNDGLQNALTGRWASLEMPKASGIEVPRVIATRGNWRVHYRDLIDFVRASTAPGERILSGVQDTSRLVINDAMVYFLADRPPATRWIEMEPGLTNTARGQTELIDALDRQRVRLLVLWNILSNEPNATSRSNGIHLLDAYVRENYSEARRFGEYVVMLRSTPFREVLAR
jgi:hypothetical protein